MRIRIAATCFGALAVVSCQGPADAPAQESSFEAAKNQILVKTQDDYNAAMKSAQPGDTIVLANGVWEDFDLILAGEGTADRPITLKGETPGGVVLSGQSSLRLGGQHLIVSDLVFRDGYTPLNEVISFRIDSETLAFNSRVTNTVVENYNNPERTQRDTWVVMYGQNNEFDHNHIAGKLNSGPTMTVRLNSEDSQQNNHRIHHNYFGPRAVFGSNGGETLRIGTSKYSLTESNTVVENNYFDRCGGEVEIVSNKSGNNTYRNNTFFESRGTLTLRHGNGTLVEGNLFDGNGAAFTGGIRVINERQTVRDNYFKNLTGTRFSGALVVMNGVPNSPINRYHQVDGVVIEGNTFDGVSAIEMSEGSDAERSAIPINTTFKDNVIIGSGAQTPFNIYDDMSGISFADNVTNFAPPAAIAEGFAVETGLAADISGDYGVERDETGVSWYPKSGFGSPFGTGKTVTIQPGENQISEALKTAASGDVIVLAAGDYNEAKLINIPIAVTVKGADGAKPKITFERANLFQLTQSGALQLENLAVSGEKAPDSVGNSFIVTNTRQGAGNHTLEISNVDFSDFMVNREFSVVIAAKSTFFDAVTVTDSRFEDISGTALRFESETDNYGIYNVEALTITDSVFKNVRGSATSVYRGGRDESTFGPQILVEGTRFENVGAATAPAMRLHGAQIMTLQNNTLVDTQPVVFTITTGKPKTVVADNTVTGAGAISFMTVTDLRK